MRFSRIGIVISAVLVTSGTILPAVSAQAQQRYMTWEERLALFRESPPEEAAKQVVLTRYKLQLEGKYMEAMKYLSPDFTEHMTPARNPKGMTGYENMLRMAKAREGMPQDERHRNYAVQARASGDMVTLFHVNGCDIFRVQNALVTDHWDCTPWQPFSNVGELKQLQDAQAREDAARAAGK